MKTALGVSVGERRPKKVRHMGHIGARRGVKKPRGILKIIRPKHRWNCWSRGRGTKDTNIGVACGIVPSAVLHSHKQNF